MSSTYYQYQEVMTKIAHRLMKMDGWTVYGYHADESDAMTDYYSPAYWGGIATKNGYTLVVNRSTGAAEYRRTYTVKTDGTASAEINAKIAKLEKMTTDRGASPAEEATAKAAIEKLREKKTAGTETREDYVPGFMANPPRCNWHIEKNGIIIDKGTGLLKFARVPDVSGYGYAWEVKEWQKFNTMSREEWIEDYKNDYRHNWGSCTDELAATRYDEAREKYLILDSFNNLIARFNNICGGMVGNDGEDGYTYEVRKVTKYKTVYKFQESASGELKAGQCFKLNASFTYGCCKGYVYRLTETATGDLAAYRVSLKSNKILTGSANRSNCFGYYAPARPNGARNKDKLLKWIEQGAILWGEVVEVREPYEVEKTFKVDKNGKDYKPTNDNPATTEKTTNYTIKADTDTRDGSAIYVVSLNDRVNAETFAAIRDEFKTNGGYYSRFKKGFIFKEYPEFLKDSDQATSADAETVTADAEPANAETVETVNAETATAETEPRPATDDDLRAIFGDSFENITRGRALFVAANGNIIDENNNVYYFNIQTSENPETVAACRDEETATEEAAPAESDEPTTEEAPAETVTDSAPFEAETENAPGFSGPASDFFSDDEIAKLINGEQLKKGEDWRAAVYIALDYIPDCANLVKFVYNQQNDAGTLHPGYNLSYCGFIYDGRYYKNLTPIREKAAEDINAELLKRINSEEAAEANAAGKIAESWKQEQIADYKTADYTSEAARMFLDDTAPDLTLYKGGAEKLNEKDLINYIINPAAVVSQKATAHAETNAFEIYKTYIIYNRTAAALDAIKADQANQAHTLKRIKDATNDQKFKTFKLLLSNGQTVRADADGVRRMAYCGYLSTWHIDNSDRDKLSRNEYGRPDDVKPAQIKKILYSGRVLYSA